MGPLGWPETVFIFFLALVLFGPKKLPELGRTVGKALTEFRRASSELKATFDREMKTLEQETQSIKEAANYQIEPQSYDYSSHESTYEGAYGYDGSYGHEHYDSTATTTPSTLSASAPQDAELPVAAPEGTVAHGSEPAVTAAKSEEQPRPSDPHAQPSPSTPHNA